MFFQAGYLGLDGLRQVRQTVDEAGPDDWRGLVDEATFRLAHVPLGTGL